MVNIIDLIKAENDLIKAEPGINRLKKKADFKLKPDLAFNYYQQAMGNPFARGDRIRPLEVPVPPEFNNPINEFYFDDLDEIKGKPVDYEGQPQPGPAEFRTRSERSTRLPRFKLKYDTQEECSLRLGNTLITIQDQVIFVMKVHSIQQGAEVGLGVSGYDRNERMVKLLLDPNGLNLRSPDPGYIELDGTAFLFRRKPARIYKQGLTSENTYFSKAGNPGVRVGLMGNVTYKALISAFEDRPVIRWDKSFLEDGNGRTSKRLSDRIAVYRKNKSINVEHRGFYLGYLRDDSVISDVDNIWVRRALEAVGLNLTAK